VEHMTLVRAYEAYKVREIKCSNMTLTYPSQMAANDMLKKNRGTG